MKLSEVRACDNCGGRISPIFHVVRMSIAVFNPQAGNHVLGLMQYFHGSLPLAEVFAPETEVVKVAMDTPEGKALMVELLLCTECWAGPVNLAVLAEKRDAETIAAQQPAAPAEAGQ